MRPFEKDSQSVVVTKGRRKTKLAAPKSTKSAATALIKQRRKYRNIRKKENDNDNDNDYGTPATATASHLSKEAVRQFVPVRRKPLAEYMKLELPTMMSMMATTAAAAAEAATTNTTSPSPSASASAFASPSPSSTQEMRMSYAAAVETGSGVKVMISPRLNSNNNNNSNNYNNNNSNNNNNKTNASKSTSGKLKGNKKIADTKFRIFDEQPTKSHIVRVDPKILFRPIAVEQPKARIKNSNSKFKKLMPHQKVKSEQNDVDIKALQLQLKQMACNAASNATVAIKGTTISPSSSGQKTTTATTAKSTATATAAATTTTTTAITMKTTATKRQNLEPTASQAPSPFADSISYLSYHQERLQRLIEKQSICAICLQTPEPMKLPQFEDHHFKYLEEAALLAQNRTMLRLWMNSDQLIC